MLESFQSWLFFERFRNHRIKRDNSIKSEEGTKCLYIQHLFQFFNWDNWVLQPYSSHTSVACSVEPAPMCKAQPTSPYGSLVYSYEKYHPMPEDDACSKFWVPHCYPNKMASVRILYVNNEPSRYFVII
ncbi:hypothetical protein CEXT_615531 [Caerostris extrusa]|uniref:Uncharacterized protein n=1 Tax=Caerostris extrusa TaxID=172846 RepID=A0AAV4QUE4_CAEEX|nr:hypothetical protein CEXT_615531 [Caerostris extrusa]